MRFRNVNYLAILFLSLVFSCKKDDDAKGTSAKNWSLTATLFGGLPNRIDFPTEKIGYICGNHGFMAKTTNGGTVWNALPSPGANPIAQLYSMCFLNSDTGFVGSDDGLGRIFKTADGGQSWTISCPSMIGEQPTKWINDIVFTDKLHGFASCRYGSILRTEDGGQTWDFAHIDKDYFNKVDFYGINFINSQVGFVAGTVSTILKTTDGGVNWTTLNCALFNTTVNPIASNQLYDVKAFDVNNILVSGRTGGLFRTSDGGATWKIVSTSTGDRIGFDTPSHGMIGGGSIGNNIAHFLETNDAGQTWQAIKVKDGSIAFRDFMFIKPGLGFGISDQEVYKYQK